MVRDIRIENHLFWPHIRNTSYEAFFEQLSGKELRENNAQYFAASMQSIDRETMSHAILDLENDLARVLAEMEVYGVHIQKSRLTELEKKLTARISQIEQEVENEIRNGYKKNSDAIPVPLLRGVEEEKYKMGVLQADKTNIEPSTINLSSPLQVQKLLFEVMKIPPIKKTKTGFSVDEETLAIIAQDHEIAEKILEHRHANKLLGTYVR